jgi:hypothetical protein
MGRTPENPNDAKVLFIRAIDNYNARLELSEILAYMQAATSDKLQRERLSKICEWMDQRKHTGMALAYYNSVRAIVARVGDTIITEIVDEWPSEKFMAAMYLALEFDKAKGT